MHVTPAILIFDLDETLFRVTMAGKERALSESAERALSSSQEGVIEECELLPEMYADCVTAIARKEIKKILDAAYEVIKRLGERSPVAVKILTSSTYSEIYIKKIFDRFYADGDARFSKNLFPIEYFNRSCLDACSTPFECQQASGGHLDLRKAKLINAQFYRWSLEIPGLKEENVYFIDNADYNVIPVKTLGFSAIHYPTTRRERPPEKRYRDASRRIFRTLSVAVSKASVS